VAIDPNPLDGPSGKIECATFFFPNDKDNGKVASWIETRQGKKNLYVSVNRARADAPHNVKLKSENIGAIRAIPTDIDVPKIKGGDPSGQHFQTARAKLLGDVASKLAAETDCPPSIIVDSGGGLQLWRQLHPMVEATPENIETVRGVGRAINERLKAEFPDFNVDNVTDLARIMRLPGTINIPDGRKGAQGRSPAEATVLVDYCSPNSYSLDHLKACAPPIDKQRSKSAKELPKIDMAAVCSATDYDELPAELKHGGFGG
jgi:hypothetical protein